jgi:outer membrane receptor protein involved in Fe transport
MGSYTRRIRRPRGWALEPFLTWINANNVQQGNPSLKNEYVDSYEAGVQTSIQKIFLSGEAYYKMTHNKIENIRSAYSENVTLTSFENIGKDYSLGTEFQMNVDPVKMWGVNLMGNVYQYRVEGILYGLPFSRESFNWNARLNNSLRFSQATQLQFNAMYNSPSVSSQGKREGFFTTDLSLRQDLFERTFSVILQIRDLFKTGKQEFTSQGAGYYSYNYQRGEAPMIMLSIKYLFNNYQSDERQRGQQDDGGGFNEGEGF